MIKYLVGLIAALAASLSFAAPSVVQSCSVGSSTGVGNATSVCSSLTAGSSQVIIAVVTAQVTISNFGGPTGAGAGCGGTPNKLYEVSNGTTPTGLAFWSIAIAGGGGACTITYVPNGSGQPIAVQAFEATGTDTSAAPNDGVGVSHNYTSAGGGSVCTCTVAMTATGTANDILFGIAVSPSATNFDFSLDTPQGAPAFVYKGGTGTGAGVSTNIAFGTESVVVSATGSYTGGWSSITQQSGGGGREVFVGAIAIKGAGAGGTTAPPTLSPIFLGTR